MLLSLITEIVSANAGSPDYMLNKTYKVDIEHILANHYEQHTDEFLTQDEFSSVRNSIGDLLVLPKSFNSSYGDKTFEEKVPHYYEQNILAQSLCKMKYENNPGFLQFKDASQLPFKSYDSFKRADINERGDLYKAILRWNWNVEEEEYNDQKNARIKEIYKYTLQWGEGIKDLTIDPANCSLTYIRFTTKCMDKLFPSVNSKTGWKNGNHYFYEIYNRIGNAARISLTVSSMGLPDNYREIAEKINAKYSKNSRKNWSYLHSFKTKKHKYGEPIEENLVYAALDACWEEVEQFEYEIMKYLNNE